MSQDQTANDADDDEFEESAEEFVKNYVQKPGFGGPNEEECWVRLGLAGHIYRSPLGARHDTGGYDRQGVFAGDFRQHGVSIVVFLAEDHEHVLYPERTWSADYLQKGFQVIQLSIPSGGVPSKKSFKGTLTTTIEHLREGRHVAIHGSAGGGRSALFVACLARKVLGLSGEEAINWVTQHIPGGVETRKQAQFVLSDGP